MCVSAQPPIGGSVYTLFPKCWLSTHQPSSLTSRSSLPPLTLNDMLAGWTLGGCDNHICPEGRAIGWSQCHQRTGLWAAGPTPYEDREKVLSQEHPKQACVDHWTLTWPWAFWRCWRTARGFLSPRSMDCKQASTKERVQLSLVVVTLIILLGNIIMNCMQ